MEGEGKSKKWAAFEEAPKERISIPVHVTVSNKENNLLDDSYSINNDSNSNNNGNNRNRVNLDATVICSKTAPKGNIFSVDYSKRGSAKCKVCNKTIAK